MIQDITSTVVVSPTITTTQHIGFDTDVNEHDYLLSIIQLPIYLQYNLIETEQLTKVTGGFPERRHRVGRNFCFCLLNFIRIIRLVSRLIQMVHQF